MKNRKTRIENRRTNFCFTEEYWNSSENIEPDYKMYLEYIEWMIDRYNPRLILKIVADLVCHHIKLYNKNPMKNELIRLRMKTIKNYKKSGLIYLFH